MKTEKDERSDNLKYYVAASVLGADLLNIESELRRMENSGIDILHYDVMDGVFVNNISYGLPVLSQLSKAAKLPIDAHLMIIDPIKYVRRFAEAGADIISFHLDSSSDTRKTIEEIRACGAKPALAIKPGTPAEAVYEYLPLLDMVLIMTVEPGFGGQSFIYDTVEKIRKVRSEIERLGLETDIEVDGGINPDTADITKKAGANVLVSGSCLFSSEDMAATANLIKEVPEC